MLVKRLPVTELMDLWIGHQGEGNSRAVEIMIAPWVKEWPDAQVIVLYERPGESVLYAGNAALDGSVVKWVIDPFATEKPGAGRMILQAKQGDAVVKSAVAVTRVTPNLQGTATEPPTPPTGFVEQVLDAAERADASAKRAEAEAEKISGYKAIAYVEDGILVLTMNVMDGDGYTLYEGEYTVRPSAEGAEVLETAQRILEEDVTVQQITYSVTGNAADGLTATIG